MVRSTPGAVATSPRPEAGSWPAPYVIRELTLNVDQTFASEQLRIQSVAPRDAATLRQRVQEARRLLRDFLASSKVVAARAAASNFSPLTVTVVPQPILSRADLWPGYPLEPGKSYGSRYVEPRRTLFIADSPGFERRGSRSSSGHEQLGVATRRSAPHPHLMRFDRGV